MPANPSSAPSGPDVARQLDIRVDAERLVDKLVNLIDWQRRDIDFESAGDLVERALADARREALEDAATEANLQASVFGTYTTVSTVADWLRQRAAQEAPK